MTPQRKTNMSAKYLTSIIALILAALGSFAATEPLALWVRVVGVVGVNSRFLTAFATVAAKKPATEHQPSKETP